jgi:asparagine synthase (glutamine-hydrolysing)
MCGIFGIVASNGRLLDFQWAPSALNAVRHRGPDDEGYLLANTRSGRLITCGGQDTDARLALPAIEGFWDEPVDLLLGHRRLSIIDLSPAGHQPMGYSQGECWLVYNGEIYNYLELRLELAAKGYHFRSQTDSEVILAAYLAWGEECLARFNGMWAFLLYDRPKRRLFAARDRFGIKPIYFYHCPGQGLAFASEIKQFTFLPGWEPRLNPQLAYDFLVHRASDHTSGTMFQEVQQLRGGEYLSLDLPLSEHDPLLPHRWYTPHPRENSPQTLQESAIHLRELLSDSVRLRLRADVPVGSCLSGGLDSSGIVCLVNGFRAQQQWPFRPKTFSACFDLEQYDERPFIESVRQATEIESFCTFPQAEELFTVLDHLIWYQDEPFTGTSVYAQWSLFRLAAAHAVKVVLDGQGADELLAGYAKFYGWWFQELLRRGRWLTLISEMAALIRGAGQINIHTLSRLGAAVVPKPLQGVFRDLVDQPLVPSWLNVSVLKNKLVHISYPKIPPGRTGGIQALSLHQITTTDLPMMLHYEDRNSMAHSVESRLPFLDYRLAEFVLGLPDGFKIHRGETKAVYRQAMQGILPELVRTRKDKMGFVTPEEIWLKTHIRIARQELMETATSYPQWFSASALNKYFHEVPMGRKKYSGALWRIICFGRWLKQFNLVL